MTQNQLSFAKLQEDARHNREMESLSKKQNRLTKQANKAQKEHFERSDRINEEHYQRSDTSGLISANAQAMNAGTNRRQYEMAYDIEYGYTGDKGFPEGTPLSAQQKNLEVGYLYETYNDRKEQERQKALKGQHENENIVASTAKLIADTDTAKTQALGNVMNALFGRKGLIGIVDTLIETNSPKGKSSP